MRKETKMADKPSRGLADVIAASTAVSDIDGRAGLLSYRGHDIYQTRGPGRLRGDRRMAGWTAHVIQQHVGHRLIRPDREYIGERRLTWVPAGQR
jgi:citrate synthase